MKSACVIFVVLFSVSLAFGQTTQPADPAKLMLRADEAFNQFDYAQALPLLEKVAELVKDDPARLGPVEEKIQVCKKNIDQPEPVLDLAAIEHAIKPVLRPTKPEPAVPSSAEERTPHAKPKAGEVLELKLKELGNFEYDPEVGGLPDDIKTLDGIQFRTTGFMIPMNQADDITEFAMVIDLFSCCFGQPPGVQHTIQVRTPKGKAVSYFNDQIVVEGTLHVEEKKEDGYVISLFELEATSVKPAPK